MSEREYAMFNFFWRGEQGKMEHRNHLSIRMDRELHDKIQYISFYEGRSMSKQILYLMLECVREFEREYGEITPSDIEKARKK